MYHFGVSLSSNAPAATIILFVFSMSAVISGDFTSLPRLAKVTHIPVDPRTLTKVVDKGGRLVPSTRTLCIAKLSLNSSFVSLV